LKKLKELLEKQERIACLLAIYEKDRGSCTKVIFQNGNELLLNQSVNTTLRAIAKHYTIDLKELRKKMQSLDDATYYVPLPISKDLLFISVKTRLPKVKKDPSISYINFYEIHGLDKKAPIIHMKNGYKIESLNALKTIKKRYHKGEICAKLQNTNHADRVEETSVHHLYPATKGDVRAIAKEIENLQELLKNILVKNIQ